MSALDLMLAEEVQHMQACTLAKEEVLLSL